MFLPDRHDFPLLKRRRAWLASTLCSLAVFGHATVALSPRAVAQTPSPETARVTPTVPPDEWLSRLKDGKLSAAEIASVAALALRVQADDALKWDARWGDFMELARNEGKLSDDLWRDYLLGAVRFRIRVATSAKRSTGLQIWVDQENARTGNHGPAAKAFGIREDDLSGIARNPGKKLKKTRMNLSSYSGNGTGWTEDLTQERYAALQPGPQTYHYRYRIQVFDEEKGKAGADGPFGERVVEGSIPWQLLADDAPPPLPALQADPALRADVEKSFSPPHLLRDSRDKTLVKVMIQVDHPPTGMAFDMSLRAGGKTWPIGPVAWAKGAIGSWAFDVDLPEEVSRADVVLTPSARALVGLADDFHHYTLMDIKTIWDGPEIIIPGVAVSIQRISMIKVRPLTKASAGEYALSQMDETDPVVQQMRRDGDVSRARGQLEQRIKEHPEDAMAHYELGCVLMADGDRSGAMKHLVEARRWKPAADLLRRIQRQQRRLCAMWLQLTETNDTPAMTALGGAYEHGWGVNTDAQEAKRWYVNGSNAGNADAMCRLAAMYEHKVGATVANDKADEWYRLQALDWYRKSAGLGNDEARQWLSTHDH